MNKKKLAALATNSGFAASNRKKETPKDKDNMKKALMAMALLLSIADGIQAAGQGQTGELTDSTSKDAIELYSDTTSVSQPITAADAQADQGERYDKDTVSRWLERMDGDDIAGMLFVLAIVFIIFVLAPVLIIVALFYFIHKNRKEKMRLAQMAIQQGQPIPGQLLDEGPADVDEEYQKGMRQCFVGVGLMIFLGYAAGQVGFGVGALVFCIGLGKVFASKTSAKKPEKQDIVNDDTRNRRTTDYQENN